MLGSTPWPCNPEEVLKKCSAFLALLDDEEMGVLAGQVELKNFVVRERIYKMGAPGGQAYVVISGRVRVTTIDEDQQEVVVDEPTVGEFFGFASMIEQTPHQTSALAIEETVCVEVSRDDVAVLLKQKPNGGDGSIDNSGAAFPCIAETRARPRQPQSRWGHRREKPPSGERVADSVARFDGSWTFIIAFGVLLAIYTSHQHFSEVRTPGIPIRSSCSTCFFPCWLPSRLPSS